MASAQRISTQEIAILKEALIGLRGAQFHNVVFPKAALAGIEPSQIGTIVGTFMDAMIPHLPGLESVGLTKHEGILGEREGYPDYKHKLGYRLELKLLYVDNAPLGCKKPPTPREPSARLTQKVTIKNVDPAIDAMLLIAYQLQLHADDVESVSPTIIDYEVFSMIELIEARDARLMKEGRWFGNYETPTILSRVGREKRAKGVLLDTSSYGRKESEGKDYNEDTNFGKLKRIPHSGLQTFLNKHRISGWDDPRSGAFPVDKL